MRQACLPMWALVLPMALAACASEPQILACTDPRPQVCTMQYQPTCGTLSSGERKTYSSDCNACADDQVISREPGVCTE